MAELGAGDSRWRVADLGEQGRNVNAWHWTNTDASGWAKQRLGELFAPGTQPLAAPGVRADGVRACKCDCELNNRKGRLIATYELELSIGWTCEEGGGGIKGTIEVPYYGDEHEDDDEPPAMRVAITDDGGDKAAADAARAALLTPEAKREVAARLRHMVTELKSGAPLKKGEMEALAADAAAAEAAGGGAGAKPAAAAAAAAAAAKPAAAAAPKPAPTTSTPQSDTDSLELEERFHARASDLFECFTVEGKLKAWSQSPATVPSAADNFLGPFSWFGGSVQGRVVAAEANKRLELEWRFTTWAEGCVSKVVLTFDESESAQQRGLCVRLAQTGIPREDGHGNLDQLALVERGWRERVFARIRQTFGYGTGGF